MAARTDGAWQVCLLDTRGADGRPVGLDSDGRLVRVNRFSLPDATLDVVAVAPASRKEGLLSAERTGLWARSPLSDHQAGSAAKVSAKCSAGIGQKQSAK